MERILEPELMEEEEQVRAYAEADFHQPNSLFIDTMKEKIGEVSGQVLELGCGPALLSLKFADANPNCIVFALDGSRTMLEEAQRKLHQMPQAKGRVVLIHDTLVEAALPQRNFQLVFSNSLLHHLHDPLQLWNAIKMYAASNAWVFMMDLMRPASEEDAKKLVAQYAGDGPDVLQRDYFNSLRAAFEENEIKDQLKQAGLEYFKTEIISDQHVIIYGRM